MKKIFTLIGSAFLFFSVTAQTWNFSSDAFKDLGSWNELKTIEGLNMYASSTAGVSVGTGAATFEDVDYTHVFKFGGTGAFAADNTTPTQRVISFAVTGNSKITVIAKHASGTATTDRFLVVAAGSKTNELGRLTVTHDGTAPVYKGVFNYEGNAPTTIFVFSANSGINLFKIECTELTTGIKNTTATIVKSEFFSLTGTFAGVNKMHLKNGIYIQKNSYDNGQVITQKILINKK